MNGAKVNNNIKENENDIFKNTKKRINFKNTFSKSNSNISKKNKS